MKEIESNQISKFSEQLSKEQKKKYRKQYIKVMIRTGLLSLVYGIAMFESIAGALTNKSLILLGLSLIFGKELMTTMLNAKEEIELIQERIIKRSKKNKKQKNKQTETNKGEE